MLVSVIGEICLVFAVGLGFMQDPRNPPVDRLVLLSFPLYPPFINGYNTLSFNATPNFLFTGASLELGEMYFSTE